MNLHMRLLAGLISALLVATIGYSLLASDAWVDAGGVFTNSWLLVMVVEHFAR